MDVDIENLISFSKCYCVFVQILNTRLQHVYYFINITVVVVLYLIHFALAETFVQS